MYLLKRNYIVGFVLLIAFILFVGAGTVGQDAEVMVGTIGFLGIVALLPLFLYLVFVDVKSKRESIQAEALDIKEGEEAKEIAGLQKLKAEETKRPDRIREPNKAGEIDKDFIEKLRADQVDIHKRTGEKTETKSIKEEDEEHVEDSGRLDIPKKVGEESESPKEVEEEPMEDSGRLDIPKIAEKEPEPPRDNDEELIEGLGAKESDKKDKSDDFEEGDDAQEFDT